MPHPSAADDRFWLQIMGDHAIMILNALSPIEADEVKKAQDFILLFNSLLAKSRENLSNEEAASLAARALEATRNLRAFKLHLLSRFMTGKINMNLAPSLINHTVNEADEYIFLLEHIENHMFPRLHPVHYHLFWLQDSLGHAYYLQSSVSFPFREIIDRADYFVLQLTILYGKALEFGGYLRTGIKNFKALEQLNADAYEQNRLFTEFFVDLGFKIQDKRIIGPLNILVLDHMYREVCYYLTQLSIVAGLTPPACDPAAPRKM